MADIVALRDHRVTVRGVSVTVHDPGLDAVLKATREVAPHVVFDGDDAVLGELLRVHDPQADVDTVEGHLRQRRIPRRDLLARVGRRLADQVREPDRTSHRQPERTARHGDLLELRSDPSRQSLLIDEDRTVLLRHEVGVVAGVQLLSDLPRQPLQPVPALELLRLNRLGAGGRASPLSELVEALGGHVCLVGRGAELGHEVRLMVVEPVDALTEHVVQCEAGPLGVGLVVSRARQCVDRGALHPGGGRSRVLRVEPFRLKHGRSRGLRMGRVADRVLQLQDRL